MSGRGGFTLAEVLAAILVLEVALVGVAGTVAVTARTLSEAARLERAVAAAGETVDSLALVATREGGIRPIPGGWIRWDPGDVDPEGLQAVRVVAVDSAGDRLLEVRAVLPVERGSGVPDAAGDGE